MLAAMTPLQIDGIDIHVEGQGEDVILMIHGWPDTYRLWDPQVEAFKGRYRCARFTLPGFDMTKPHRPTSLDQMTTLIGRIVDALSPGRPVILLVHDWGCAFGYQYVMTQPQRVKRLIGVDIGDAGSRAHQRSLPAKAKLGVLAYQWALVLAWYLGRAGDGLTRKVAAWARAPADPSLIGAGMNYPYVIQWTGAYGSYRGRVRLAPPCPMLFIYGRRKPFMFHSPEWRERLAADPRNAVLALDTGHWVMHQAPQAFNEAVLGWLARDTAAASAAA
jgi:pimeloyl-ACP methyl ester carboxylesterase